MSIDDRPDDWHGPRTSDEGIRRRLGDVLSLLADQRRRDLLYHLAETEVTDVGTLASKVAAVDEGMPIEEVSPELRKKARVSLEHVHLPKLADAGAIEFDPRSGAIRCRNMSPVVGRLADTCCDIEKRE